MQTPPRSSHARSLLLVDDHTIVREGIKRILEPLADWVVTEAATGFQALDRLRQETFSLAIVDLSMPGMPGLDLIRRMKSSYPAMAVMVLSMHAEEQYAMRAFKAGANGYLTKDSAAAELAAAVVKVADGGSYVTASLAERLVQQLSGVARAPRHDSLSDRELDVAQRIVAGQRLTDIADALHLSVKTVSTHKSRILDKLQLPNSAALIRYGLENDMGANDSGLGALARSMPEEEI
ncbi:response regulator [Rhizobacter fulvus]